MNRWSRFRVSWRVLPWLAAVVAAFTPCFGPVALADEMLGDLNVRLRAVETQVAVGGTSGVARIEAVVETFSPVEAIEIRCFLSDGRPWTPATQEFDPGALTWRRDPAAAPLSLGGPFSLGRRDRASAEIEVPLAQRGLYEIVVRARGTTANGPVQTEAMVRVPVGVSVRPVEVDGVAEFRAVAPREVQP